MKKLVIKRPRISDGIKKDDLGIYIITPWLSKVNKAHPNSLDDRVVQVKIGAAFMGLESRIKSYETIFPHGVTVLGMLVPSRRTDANSDEPDTNQRYIEHIKKIEKYVFSYLEVNHVQRVHDPNFFNKRNGQRGEIFRCSYSRLKYLMEKLYNHESNWFSFLRFEIYGLPKDTDPDTSLDHWVYPMHPGIF